MQPVSSISPIWDSQQGTFRHRCKYCGSEFLGRENRLYCSQACKSRYNNEKGAEKRKALMAAGMGSLHNEKILKGILGQERSVEMSPEELKRHGFDFEAPSRRRAIPSGHTAFSYGAYLIVEKKPDVRLQITKNEQQ